MKIVVSRFNENMEWTEQLNDVIIYNKGNADLKNYTNVINLENVGREGHTYYTHIYNNYDNLDDYTAFLQGNPFDHSPNIIHNLNTFLHMKNDFQYLSEEIITTTNQICPHHKGIPLLDVYKKLFNDNYTNTSIEFGVGAQFIVSKKFILSKPRSFYLQIIDLLNKSSCPPEGYVIERFHRIIFDNEYKLKCESFCYMDLSRIELIKKSSLNDLQDIDYVEKLIIKLGFNNEFLHEQPKIVKDNAGGLRIWQYPNQFSKYLCLLQKQCITSYIEIGCRWGGTFILTNEYFKLFNEMKNSVAVDLSETTVDEYCTYNNAQFIQCDSHSDDFKIYMKKNKFDLILIDGDHSYEGVKADYEISKDSCRILVFHDILNDSCLGVVQFWNELKRNEMFNYEFHEFTEQYEDVWNNTNRTYLGIGVAIKKVVNFHYTVN